MIKFRAYVSNDVNIPDGMYKVVKMVFEPEMTLYIQLGNVVQRVNGEFKLMQFTGYQDKTGRDVYEGDVLEFVSPYDKQRTSRSSVELLLDTLAGFGIKDINGSLIGLYRASTESHSEVVGNIYED